MPLGLTRMSVHIGPGLEDFTATRYTPDGTPIPFYDFDHPGGSAVFSSAHDLVRFGMFHLKNHLSDQRPIIYRRFDRRDAATDLPRGGRQRIRHRLGVADQQEGLAHCVHRGGMAGVSTNLVLLPDQNAVGRRAVQRRIQPALRNRTTNHCRAGAGDGRRCRSRPALGEEVAAAEQS